MVYRFPLMLLTCPHCGREGEEHHLDLINGTQCLVTIVCKGCGCTGPGRVYMKGDIRERDKATKGVIAAWNRRVPDGRGTQAGSADDEGPAGDGPLGV